MRFNNYNYPQALTIWISSRLSDRFLPKEMREDEKKITHTFFLCLHIWSKVTGNIFIPLLLRVWKCYDCSFTAFCSSTLGILIEMFPLFSVLSLIQPRTITQRHNLKLSAFFQRAIVILSWTQARFLWK